MTIAAPKTQPAEQGGREVISGWGRTNPSASQVVRLASASEVSEWLVQRAHGARGAVARGLGRSYGDAAQRAGGAVLDITAIDHVGEVDASTGEVVLGGGASFDSVLRRCLPSGWFLPVTPGTRQVTVGGAIASDVHGKNHHRDGSLGSWVRSIELATPSGVYRFGPAEHPDLFWSTVGGLGLTGVITEARLQMVPVESSWMLVESRRTRRFEETLTGLEDQDRRHRYSVAWLDCLAGGSRFGRGVITAAEHAGVDDLPTSMRGGQLTAPTKKSWAAPPWAPDGLLNRLSVRSFNELWFRRSPSRSGHQLASLSSFFHPLDGIENWNRLYGTRGFVQYQSLVPFGAEEALRETVSTIGESGVPAFLAVLKRFGPGDPGPLSFPFPGWTLAVDLPVRAERLAETLDRLDEITAAAGGRVYLAKDSRLRPDLVEVMYPRLPDWRLMKRTVDPDGILRSDLAERLGLLRGEGL